MYLPAHFQEPRVEALHGLIREHPFGALVTSGPDGLDANHLPFELVTESGGHGRLLAHVARTNPVWSQLADGERVLVIFRGPHAYVSPNGYPSQHESHRQVPTWNYQVVHAHGTVRVRDDESFLRGLVARLTREHEGRLGAARPWRMSASERDFVDGMLAAIVGLEVEIDRLEGKWKLGQNKDERDRRGAAEALRERGEGELADAMLATLGKKPSA